MRKFVETTIAVIVLLFVMTAVPAMAQTHLRLAMANDTGLGDSSAQTTPARYPAGTKLSVAWDAYTAAELAANLATRYEVVVTGPTPGTASVAIPTTQFALPTLAPGSYTASVKGCAEAGCGPAATVSFIVEAVVPTAPRGIAVQPTPPDQAMSLEQAGVLGHAYSVILQGRPLADSEMSWLIMKYAQSPEAASPLSRPALVSFLDRTAAELIQNPK